MGIPLTPGAAVMIRRPVLLAVDDEAGLLERFATPLGFSVVTDDGAGNAIARIGEMSPDVAMIDFCIPGDRRAGRPARDPHGAASVPGHSDDRERRGGQRD